MQVRAAVPQCSVMLREVHGLLFGLQAQYFNREALTVPDAHGLIMVFFRPNQHFVFLWWSWSRGCASVRRSSMPRRDFLTAATPASAMMAVANKGRAGGSGACETAYTSPLTAGTPFKVKSEKD
jgi:hypothetical protein